MKTLMEGWRKLLNERTFDSKIFRGKTFKEFVKMLEEDLGNAFVVFDTETTGLRATNPEVQITELAAVAYDMDPWFKERGDPKPITISNIPEEYKDFISPDGQFSVKVKLTKPVLDELRKQKALMAVTDKSDPLHVRYARGVRGEDGKYIEKGQIHYKASKEAFKFLDEQFKTDSSLKQRRVSKKTGRPIKGMEPTQKGWRVWRSKYNELDRSLTPEDIPLYSKSHTDKPSEMGYKPGDKSGTVAALLSLGRYGTGEAPFKDNEVVFKAFETYLELIQQSPQTRDVVVTAQNAPFDVGQMNEAYKLLGIPAPDYVVFDTAAAFREFLKPRVQEIKDKINADQETTEQEKKILSDLTAISRATEKEYITVSLGPLTKAFDIPDLGWHAAIADVKMTMAVFLAVLNYIDKLDKAAEDGLPPTERTADDEARDLADRQGTKEDPIEIPPEMAVTTTGIPGLENIKESINRLQEEWNYALTRKQRELIEREIAALKKNL